MKLEGKKTLAQAIEMNLVELENIIVFLSLSCECMDTHARIHAHTHTSRQRGCQPEQWLSKLHRGSYASADALLLSCQLMFTERS